MAKLTIYRGTHQIGGCCTELSVNGERVLIDFGANLPNSDEAAPIKDDALIDRVFDGRPVNGVLFTHYHGDHYGLFRKIEKNTPMYIGPLAKEILQVLTPYIDLGTAKKGLPLVDRMRTYQAGRWMKPSPSIDLLPLYVDHSALDAYMFYIKMSGRKILFTGDFRDHGIVGEKDRLWRTLEKYVPKGIDLLITEGTMLSRIDETGNSIARTERELGARAAELFARHKYNFVLVSSTNLDSIMEFYHNTPEQMHFVCDLYQAKIIITAMKGMEDKGKFHEYRVSEHHKALRVLGKPVGQWERWRKMGASLKSPIDILPVSEEELERDGFVLLARKNNFPEKPSRFEELRDRYFDRDGQIIYSMWKGYLEEAHADRALQSFIGGRPYEQLHTSGHAYVETIAKLIETVDPKIIIPMHTERAEQFASVPVFAPYKDQVRVLQDGESLNLNTL